jgi:hypothetical protein
LCLRRTGGRNVKRLEIVASMRQAQSEAEAGLYGDSEEVSAYRRHLAAKVELILGQIEPEMDIPSCADFAHLGVECCPVCHDEYPDEMALVEIESGGRAWICCALERALNPSKHAAMEQTPEWQELARLFSPDSTPD